jgi:4-diphosphocytidyl-2-C-methyl-D-erythritol kinase
VTGSGTIRRDAPAKINVFLRVLRAREDGYHDLESLVVPISLADRLEVTLDERLTVDVAGDRSLAAEVPAGDVPPGGLNLALVAALALADAVPSPRGGAIRIEKAIPVAAGLGGGSADAAATLLALNELWGAPLDVAGLADVAERVGSDVPAMVLGRPVLVSGRGELLAPATVPSLWWVLVTPPLGIRSPDAYRWWDEDAASTGPDPGPLLEAAERGDAEALGPLLFNDLEAPVASRHLQIAAAKRRLLEAGALGAVMSGSGSSVVGLARDAGHAASVAATIEGARVVSGPPASEPGA